MKLFLSYTWKVLGRWRSLFTVVPFLVATILTFTGYQLLLPTWVWALLLILALHFAGFAVFKSSIRPETVYAEIALAASNVVFGGHGWQNRMPTSPLRFIADIEMRNTGSEQARLDNPSSTKWDVGTHIISDRPNRIILRDLEPATGRRRERPFPTVIPAAFFDPALTLEIQVDLKVSSVEPLARAARTMEPFAIELTFPYESLSGEKKNAILNLEGTYDSFREGLFAGWERTNDQQPLSILRGAD